MNLSLQAVDAAPRLFEDRVIVRGNRLVSPGFQRLDAQFD